MQNVECAEVKIGQTGTVQFEIGQMVSVGNIRESIVKIWQREDGTVRLELRGGGNTFAPYAVRFMNNDVDSMCSNALLEILESEHTTKELRAHYRKIKNLRKAMQRRRESLEKTHKLCEAAVEAQLRKEYPDLF